MEKKGTYKVDRLFCEKLIALLNRGTNPLMDAFRADKNMKIRVVADYDPQAEKIEVTYFAEESLLHASEEATLVVSKEHASWSAADRKEIGEIANITYHRLLALMEDGWIDAGLQNEAWELAEALVGLLYSCSTIPAEKVRKYASGIMEFAMAMYLSKIAGFPEEGEKGRYRHCNDFIKLWLAGRDILKNIQQDAPADANM